MKGLTLATTCAPRPDLGDQGWRPWQRVPEAAVGEGESLRVRAPAVPLKQHQQAWEFVGGAVETRRPSGKECGCRWGEGGCQDYIIRATWRRDRSQGPEWSGPQGILCW